MKKRKKTKKKTRRKPAYSTLEKQLRSCKKKTSKKACDCHVPASKRKTVAMHAKTVAQHAHNAAHHAKTMVAKYF